MEKPKRSLSDPSSVGGSPERIVRVEFPWHKELAGSDHKGSYYRWRPGIRWEEIDGYREAEADGVGAMLLVEIGRYTPPGYRERVFYTRQFVLPSGEAVGHPKLRVIGSAGFTVLCRGYRYGYDLTDVMDDVRMESDVEAEAIQELSADGEVEECPL